MIGQFIALGCLIWYVAVIIVSLIGALRIRHNYTSKPSPPISSRKGEDAPHITIIRPVKGVEPHLYDCLASTFKQDYPSSRLTIYFCVSSRTDPSGHILQQLIADYPGFDARLFIEDDDADPIATANLGPNPKIRNMSLAYSKAKGDLVWIVDCNVFITPPTAARLTDLLCGFSHPKGKKFKFVHQVPLVTDVTPSKTKLAEGRTGGNASSSSSSSSWGGKLEELFLSTAHAKFYTAINTVSIAPCILGKSNMFRLSHLNALTSPSSPLPVKSTASVPQAQQRMQGIDYFSSNICEDHLIGDLLWKNPVPESVLAEAAFEGGIEEGELRTGKRWRQLTQNPWGNHGLLPPHPGNLAVQPVEDLPLQAYVSRRVRWLRVRKFTVLAATLVEPGTEAFLCSAYGAYGLTYVSAFSPRVTFGVFWIVSVVAWMLLDRWVWHMMQGEGWEGVEDVPFRRKEARSWWEWMRAWLAREALALPVWIWAFYGGLTVEWRGRKFVTGTDLRVREAATRKVK